MNFKSKEPPYTVLERKKDLYENIFKKISTILNNPSLAEKFGTTGVYNSSGVFLGRVELLIFPIH